MAVDASTIVELDDMKNFLNIPSGDTDANRDSVITILLDSLNDIIEDYLGVVCITDTYTEKYDGDGTASLYLDHAPIVAVSSLTIDDEAVASGDYSVYEDEGKITLDSDIFTKDNQNVEITYTAGYGDDRAAVPEPLKLALRTWVSRMYKSDYVDFSPQMGEGAAGSVPFLDIPWDIKRMLTNYRVVMMRD